MIYTARFGKIEDIGDGCLAGVCFLFGVLHHVLFIRVIVNEDGVQATYSGLTQQWEELEVAFEPDGAWHTVKVPGFDGDYVTFISPGSPGKG